MIKITDLVLEEHFKMDTEKTTIKNQCKLIEEQKESLKKHLRKTPLNTTERK